MNEEIVKAINEKKVQEDKKDSENSVTWLIFSMGEEKFALASSDVQEIIRDVEVYHLPFLPSYIDGVLNRRGDPYTVINPLVLLDKIEKEDNETSEDNNAKKSEHAKMDVPLFLVLNIPNDQLCLRITDILFFHESRTSDLHTILNNNAESGFYRGTVDYHHTEIPVLSSDAFELRLRNDLGST